MIPSPARPKAPTKPRAAASPPSPARGPGRPRKGAEGARVRDLPGVTVRVEKTVLARLDAEVDRRNAALAAQGASTNRGAVMAIALREFCERAEAAARAAEGGA
jgi:hypothetical protein